ncbi:SDR family NAD(P)-dependent oxidoreductase [Pusillimonas sp.]|uniref:SDR family NAD(P)-dependent oxidoreductase n=1 Tax=Pusillimonas sp. TaxID=3040095 RepID=UPI0037CA5F49
MITYRSFDLNGRSALVTGAGRGLGAAIAQGLAAAGAKTYVLSRNSSQLNELAESINAGGGHAQPVVCDITDPQAVQAALDAIDQLDILVNNAGTNIPADFVDVTPAQLDELLLLNVRAVFLTAQAAARKIMGNGNGGSIINISSQMGHVGAVRRSVYCMSKHAVEGLTKSMALELATHNIRVNTVAPTFVQTPMTEAFFKEESFRDWVMQRLPMGRLLPAEDVAAAVCYLASPAAAMITGASLKLDGGWTAQ